MELFLFSLFGKNVSVTGTIILNVGFFSWLYSCGHTLTLLSHVFSPETRVWLPTQSTPMVVAVTLIHSAVLLAPVVFLFYKKEALQTVFSDEEDSTKSAEEPPNERETKRTLRILYLGMLAMIAYSYAFNTYFLEYALL